MNEKINEAIKKSGLKKKWIAEQLDITYNSLRRKIKGEIPFTKLELEKIYSILEKYIWLCVIIILPYVVLKSKEKGGNSFNTFNAKIL